MKSQFKPLPPEKLGAVVPGYRPPAKGWAHAIEGVVGFVVIGLVVWGGQALWEHLDESGYIYHDKMTTVYSRDWASGEYKECSNVNAKTDELYLQCDDLTLAEKGRVFKVRFYGQTYVAERPFEALHYWKCRKNGESDPVIICEHRLAPGGK